MKRREMLMEIENIISQMRIGSFSDDIPSIAEAILHIVEYNGMAPPENPNRGHEVEERNPTGTINYYRKFAREWEPEDG